MTQWFRRPDTDPLPPTPGGSGGSGFGGVGEGPTDDTRATRRTRTGAGPTTNGRGPRIGRPSTPEERRFAQVYAEDRVGPMPYPNQASPDVGAARSRVRALVDQLLPDGVDEGTGDALDPLVASWASGWLSRIDSEHADHHAVIDRLIGGARRQLTEAEATHERDRRALEIARRDYDEARARLIEPVVEDEARPRRRGWLQRLGLRRGRLTTGRATAAPRGIQNTAPATDAEDTPYSRDALYSPSDGRFPSDDDAYDAYDADAHGADAHGADAPTARYSAPARPARSPNPWAGATAAASAPEPDPYRVTPAEPVTGPLPAVSPTGTTASAGPAEAATTETGAEPGTAPSEPPRSSEHGQAG